MPVQVTHNNDGHFYTIDVDIAKEGAQVFDLSTYFKARVADNHTGLRVRWFWQGQIFNTVGKKPRVEGVVGQYSFKKGTNGTRELVMSPDASPVASDGDVSACEPGGYATYYFPGQMFPQEGLFKGTIGLVDDSGGTAHYTSVDIWFKVYPQAGGAQMGRACDFYISELDKAIKEAEDDLTAAKKSMQQVVDDFTAKMNDLSNQITTQANTDKAALAALETKIAQDDIVTKPELDAFKQTINDELAKFNDETVSEISKASRRLDHQFEYLSMGINISNGTQGQTTFDNEYSACENNLMDFTLIDRVDVPSPTDTTFTPTSDSAMQYATTKLHQNGRKILMLKPHLFMGGHEIYRENYKPSDIASFYANWQAFLEHEAQVCTDNDIPVLCIETEMNSVFADQYYDYARSMISNLKTKYPKLKLTAACNKFFVAGFKKILSLVDIIGINVYPSYTSSIPTDISQVSVPDAAEFMFNSDRLAQKIDNAVLEFNKPVMITEVGIYPFPEALLQPLLSIKTQDIIDGKLIPNFDVTALAMKAAIEGMAYADSVIGVSWFVSGVPMFFKDYYREDAGTRNVAEKAWNQLSESYYWEGRN